MKENVDRILIVFPCKVCGRNATMNIAELMPKTKCNYCESVAWLEQCEKKLTINKPPHVQEGVRGDE